MSMVLTAVAVASYAAMARNLRISGDVRDLNAFTAQAKMRAAQYFTHARVRVDLVANSYQVEFWDKTGAGCWRQDTYGGTPPCATAGDALEHPLSQGVTFGFAAVGAGGPNPQAVIAQAPACTLGVAGAAPGAAFPNSACVEFNSRGLPVAANGSPTALDALYITDNRNVYGVTVIISGLIQVWTSSASQTAWQAR